MRDGHDQAEVTPGNQWRVPVSEVERLKREGHRRFRVRCRWSSPVFEDADPGKACIANASASSTVTAAAEEVQVLRHQAEALAVRKQVEEELDWFRARARKERDGREAQAEAQRSSAEQAQRERQRAAWLADWQRAMKLIPQDAPSDAPQQVHTAVADALANVRTDESARLVEPLVRGIVDCEPRAWGDWWRWWRIRLGKTCSMIP